ncbi:conjugal transfer protein TraB [Elizabethkingia anophelis]|nr:conjugal transfer protein TraB [Elizabethkingia anophelis]MDV3599968.1 conjugal transfer protein TraB [Elizabethkingia anophelis]MDV3605888.1 conjugal transfer protein TraB [Elizabethkingia anophelis]MDV3638729.1 conjugal transfer protein TraB [Elizabethkingia anophelis]MDV3648894.1 conjugal transfer protein TraB [Elizabethkingia anophelis]
MMNLMLDGVQKEGLKVTEEPDEDFEIQTPKLQAVSEDKPPGKDKRKTKIKNDVDYESLFFRKNQTHARSGKVVYVRAEFHEKLSRIVQVIGEDKISLYTYVDNILEYHFKEFGEEIIKSFNEKYKPIL